MPADHPGHRNHRPVAEQGDRIIEIGCVELLNRKLTGNNLHFYLNPGRDSHEDALKVHGISNEFLRDKPPFGRSPTNCWTTWRAPRSSSTTRRSTSVS
jgi:DNA polymerase III epsilon subunit-like protein